MSGVAVSESEFVESRLFEAIPFIFDGSRGNWLGWRREAGQLLNVDPRNLLVVGSAAHGYSIKNGRDFSSRSDVDLAVISGGHFDEAWRFLRTAKLGTLKCTASQRDHVKSSAPTYVYRGCIATDYILPILPFGASWQRAAGRLGLQLPGGVREVNFRLYRDIEALRSYQEHSHRRFKKNWRS